MDHAIVADGVPREDGAVEDATWLVRVRAGNPTALGTLFRQQAPMVERLLGRLLGRRQDMEDLVQNVFLEACQALPGFRGASALSTFIGGIAVRVSRRAMRPSPWWRRRGPMPIDPPAAGASPERAAIANEQLARVRAALERLSPKKRVAFLLWALDGRSVEEVARLMASSVSATRSRIYYAQKEIERRARTDPVLGEIVEGADR